MRQWTMVELCSMFAVVKDGRKQRVRKERISRRLRKAACDKVRAGVTKAPPGKGRVQDLARFYQEQMLLEPEARKSAFYKAG